VLAEGAGGSAVPASLATTNTGECAVGLKVTCLSGQDWWDQHLNCQEDLTLSICDYYPVDHGRGTGLALMLLSTFSSSRCRALRARDERMNTHDVYLMYDALYIAPKWQRFRSSWYSAYPIINVSFVIAIQE
jgi:hypothetical protein